MPFFDPMKNKQTKKPVQVPQKPVEVESEEELVIEDEADEALMLVEEIAEVDEAQKRFRKAKAYDQVAEMNLFGDDEEAEAYEVEAEIRAFAKERMRVYLGMSPDKTPPRGLLGGPVGPVQVKLPFTEKQVQVLCGWADTLISRPKLLGAMTPTQRGRPDVPRTEEPEEEAPQARPAPAATSNTGAAPRRGRGRPPGTGKHQRARAAATLAQQQGPDAQPALPPGAQQRLHTENALVDENGKPYIMVESHGDDGNTVMKKHYVSEQAAPAGTQPAPWPQGHSPLENSGGTNQIRVSRGFDPASGSANGSVPLQGGGALQNAIAHFSR